MHFLVGFGAMVRVGQQLVLMGRTLEIVGVTNNLKFRGVTEEVDSAFIYEPISQLCLPYLSFMVRSAVSPQSTTDAVRRAIWEVDEHQAISSVRLMEDAVQASTAIHRSCASLLALLAGVATLIAVAGIYGVMSYTVAQRSREIGIRRAFGATSQDVFAAVLRRGLVLTAIGVGVGLGAALAGSHVLEAFLFEVGRGDPISYAGAALALVVVAVTACVMPALRACRIDPMASLRQE